MPRLWPYGGSLILPGCAFLLWTGLYGQSPAVPPGQTLSDKYGPLRDVLRGSSGRLRLDATFAPLPAYPEPLQRAGRQGLVVVELVVGPDGRMKEHLVLESFDPVAAGSVIEALKMWRFYSIEEMKRILGMEDCEKCVRISRLAFRFAIQNGKGVVIDLADEENRRLKRPNIYDSAKH